MQKLQAFKGKTDRAVDKACC